MSKRWRGSGGVGVVGVVGVMVGREELVWKVAEQRRRGGRSAS